MTLISGLVRAYAVALILVGLVLLFAPEVGALGVSPPHVLRRSRSANS